MQMDTVRFQLEELKLGVSEADLQAMNTLLGTRFSKKGWLTSPEKIKTCLGHGGIICIVRDNEANGKIVGTINLVCTHEMIGSAWSLGYICTDEALERRGIATAMIRYLHERARELGISSISLGVRVGNDKAIRLYEKLGYVRRTGFKYRISLE